MLHPPTILIAGPTASGKSAIAMMLADELGATIVNADSMQVYRDLAIVTARPSDQDEARLPHRLYGHIDAADAYSVARWLADVEAVTQTEAPRIFVGGTGLYFDALTKGIAPVPDIDPVIRAKWRDHAAQPGADLHAALMERDPQSAARLKPGDIQRLIRALEVIESTGRPLSHWQQNATAPLVDPAQALRVVLTPPRAPLRQAIAARFEAMIAAGALGEIEALLARRLDPSLPAMKALGVQPLAAHVRGQLTRDEAVAQAVLETGRYAKRQDTWFRNRMHDWIQLAPEAAFAHVMQAIRP